MPRGFIGKASLTYFSTIHKALSSANEVHSRDPLRACSASRVPKPVLPERMNKVAPHAPEEAMSGGYVTKVGNSSNVVVDEDTYLEMIQMIRRIDLETAEALYRIATQIEEMCKTIYIAPSTSPKYLAAVEKVKASLNEFQTLTDRAVTHTYGFVDEMIQNDGS